MKQRLETLLRGVVESFKSSGDLAAEVDPVVVVEHTRDASHGDFAGNLAMVLANPMRSPPRQLAQRINDPLPEDPVMERIEIAVPG